MVPSRFEKAQYITDCAITNATDSSQFKTKTAGMEMAIEVIV